jgi:hypothetical protein
MILAYSTFCLLLLPLAAGRTRRRSRGDLGEKGKDDDDSCCLRLLTLVERERAKQYLLGRNLLALVF